MNDRIHMSDKLLTRRHALQSLGCGFGYLALAGLANEAAAQDPLAPKAPHHTAKAKRVVFIFMQGGPSHVDTFDAKPEMVAHDGEMISFDDARTLAKTNKVVEHR